MITGRRMERRGRDFLLWSSRFEIKLVPTTIFCIHKMSNRYRQLRVRFMRCVGRTKKEDAKLQGVDDACMVLLAFLFSCK